MQLVVFPQDNNVFVFQLADQNGSVKSLYNFDSLGFRSAGFFYIAANGFFVGIFSVSSNLLLFLIRQHHISVTTMKQSIFLNFLLLAGASAFVPGTSSRQAFTSRLSVVDDKTEVREYFNTEGFSRWNKIYSESDEVNTVQMDIRDGHGQTIQKILNWIQADGDISGKTLADCGCGVGSLAIPVAQMGAYFSLWPVK